jgi:hypothetical protein
MGKNINNGIWFTSSEVLQWYYICALVDIKKEFALVPIEYF